MKSRAKSRQSEAEAVKPLLVDIVGPPKAEYESEIPLEWKIWDIKSFSFGKSLFEYQINALKNAAVALYFYFGDESPWHESETDPTERKHMFLARYGDKLPAEKFAIPEFSDRRGQKPNPIYGIYSQCFTPRGGVIEYENMINRMSFWMATGSGKTLVIVKLAEHLANLKKSGKVPPCNMLILAPTDHALEQIKAAVRELNSKGGGMRLDLRNLREFSRRPGVLQFSDVAPIYWCRSDHLSEEKKDLMMDWRSYDDDGRWFVFLDEAHKGSKEDSKRKAYCSLLARNGFLFNFSATFKDDDDICTVAARYNLSDFVADGRGKRILLARSSFAGDGDFSANFKKTVILESMMALASARACARHVRQAGGGNDFYHMPLMLTMVNSVNTEEHKNDLWAYFRVMRDIANGELAEGMFDNAKNRLLETLRSGERMFESETGGGQDAWKFVQRLTIDSLRLHVFGDRQGGPLEYIKGGDGKQIAFKLKTAEEPFALIKIGEISHWTNDFLKDMESVPKHDKSGWFDRLDEHENFSILMGSRAFFESWDSTRPNVINFLNIGMNDALVFISQAVGRGVRIAPLRGKRLRREKLIRCPDLHEDAKRVLGQISDKVAPLETLILYATNKDSVRKILQGMTGAHTGCDRPFRSLPDLSPIEPPPFPLLVPEYSRGKREKAQPIYMPEKTMNTVKQFAKHASDSLLAVAYGMSPLQIANLRNASKFVQTRSWEDAFGIKHALARICRAADRDEKEVRRMRPVDAEDIVHFRHMKAAVSEKELANLRVKIESAGGSYQRDGVSLFIRRCARHYYAPMITANERASFIRHIVDEESEAVFLQDLGAWTGKTKPAWDSWMFCKLHPRIDRVHIPYPGNDGDMEKFYPDFIFWMRRGDEYQVVFVDPKGTKHKEYFQKVDGYISLFEESERPRIFSCDGARVQVKLLLYNKSPTSDPLPYKRFWTANPADIFAF